MTQSANYFGTASKVVVFLAAICGILTFIFPSVINKSLADDFFRIYFVDKNGNIITDLGIIGPDGKEYRIDSDIDYLEVPSDLWKDNSIISIWILGKSPKRLTQSLLRRKRGQKVVEITITD